MIMFQILRCIISFLYIKPQPSICCVLMVLSWIISFLYIKPQLKIVTWLFIVCCIISFLYIKPQLYTCWTRATARCIISFLYIKPQRQFPPTACATVVLYRFSTSNHNLLSLLSTGIYVVLYRFSTSNHNWKRLEQPPRIVVLYRFSTSNHNNRCILPIYLVLYYIVSLHQTTTERPARWGLQRCIISFLYIKPQQKTR